VDLDFAEQFAERWAAARNSHDLDRILERYTDDIVSSSPLIAQILDSDVSEVHGKAALRDYWSKGLELNPDLHFHDRRR
jgi:ketosteroid isomerase-like protein